MSSKESGPDEETLIIWPLPWLSEKVEMFKNMLDNENEKGMNAQSKRQKIKGASSTRPKPQKGSGWMFKSEEVDSSLNDSFLNYVN